MVSLTACQLAYAVPKTDTPVFNTISPVVKRPTIETLDFYEDSLEIIKNGSVLKLGEDEWAEEFQDKTNPEIIYKPHLDLSLSEDTIGFNEECENLKPSLNDIHNSSLEEQINRIYNDEYKNINVEINNYYKEYKNNRLNNEIDINIKEERYKTIISDFCKDGVFTPEAQQWINQYLSVSFPLDKMTVTSGFGERIDPFTGKKTKHNGIDLRANNEIAYAMLPGVVEKVGYDKRSGHYVTLRHADYMVSYCHLSEAYVSKGDLVFPRQPIAHTGNTGRSASPHLHITLKKGKKPMDPQILFNHIQIIKRNAIHNLISSSQ